MAFSEETKKQAFKNANGKCEKCKKELNYYSDSWEAHHKISQKSDGLDVLSNCEILCKECHQETYTYGRP